MAAELSEFVIESADPLAAASFWAEALAWQLRTHQPGDVPWVSASGNADAPDLKLVFVPPRRGEPGAMHMYLRAGSDLGEEVERLCGLGASRKEALGPPPPWTALVDPGGAGFSVMAPDVGG
jgi:predicted enzyme related to lactoylglutathione lyase